MEVETIEYIPKVGKCGFRNIGNTCYMNSILQLLLHCKPLISFLINKEQEISNKSGKTEMKGDYYKYLQRASIENVVDETRKKFKIDTKFEIPINKEEVYKKISNSITSEISKIVDTIVNKGGYQYDCYLQNQNRI